MTDWYNIWNKQKPETVTEVERNGWEIMDTAFNDLRIPYVNHFANITASDSVLDIGCGTGMLVSKLNCQNKLGVDFSKEQIEFATKQHHDVEFICGNFLDMQFEKKFDTVICFSALQYIDSDKTQLFVEKAMSLAKKNVCFFDVPNAHCVEQNQMIRVSKKPDIGFFTKEWFDQFASKVYVEDWNMPFYRYNHIRYNVRLTVEVDDIC